MGKGVKIFRRGLGMITYWQTTGTPMIKFLDKEGDTVSISAPIEGDIRLVFDHFGEKTEYVIKKATKKPGIVMIGKNRFE